MKDIHEVLRRKQAKYAQLAKQIEALQQAAEKLREVAPLLAENDDDDTAVLAEVGEHAAQLPVGAADRQRPDVQITHHACRRVEGFVFVDTLRLRVHDLASCC